MHQVNPGEGKHTVTKFAGTKFRQEYNVKNGPHWLKSPYEKWCSNSSSSNDRNVLCTLPYTVNSAYQYYSWLQALLHWYLILVLDCMKIGHLKLHWNLQKRLTTSSNFPISFYSIPLAELLASILTHQLLKSFLRMPMPSWKPDRVFLTRRRGNWKKWQRMELISATPKVCKHTKGQLFF